MAEEIEPPHRPQPETGSGEDETRPAEHSRSQLVRWMSIGDANSGGFVHGGSVMRLVDEAAGLAGGHDVGEESLVGQGGELPLGARSEVRPVTHRRGSYRRASHRS